MSQEIIVRPMTADDKQEWLPLWKGYQQFYHTVIPAEVMELVWQRLLDPAEPMHAYLALDQGKVVGIVHTIYHRTCWSAGDYCYLQDLFVDSDCRGNGVGRALIEHVYRQAQQDGCSRVHWLTHETNHTAMRLYDTLADKPGFVQYRHLFA